MKYQEKTFTEFFGSKEYRDNWEKTFGKKDEKDEYDFSKGKQGPALSRKSEKKDDTDRQV